MTNHGPAPSRRHFLVGSASLALLAACGGDSDGDGAGIGSEGDTTGDDANAQGASLDVVQFFGGPVLAAGTALRAPFGIADVDGILPVDASPGSVTVDVTREGEEVASAIEVPFHSEGLPRGYYPLTFDAPEPGIYDAAVRFDRVDAPLELPIQVSAAADVAVPGPGDPLPSVATPTEGEARGVTPICTRQPVCPLHQVTVEEALTRGAPLALMISTPEFCQTAVCGPVLDVFLAELEAFDGVTAIHSEVYADPETDLSEVAPMVAAMNLTYEPSLVLVGADGTITERIDFVFDAVEIRRGLERLTA